MVEAKPKTKAAPKKKGAAPKEEKAPALRAPKSPEEKQSYTAGVTCGRGKHHWVDKGSYFKCEGGQDPLCRSTKTKHATKPKAPKKGKASPKGKATPQAGAPAAAPAASSTLQGATQAPSLQGAAQPATAVGQGATGYTVGASLPDSMGMFVKVRTGAGEEFYARYMEPLLPGAPKGPLVGVRVGARDAVTVDFGTGRAEVRQGLGKGLAAPRTPAGGPVRAGPGKGAGLGPFGGKRPAPGQ